MAVSATACMQLLLEKHKFPSDYDEVGKKIQQTDCTPGLILENVQQIYKTSKQKLSENQTIFLQHFIDVISSLSTLL